MRARTLFLATSLAIVSASAALAADLIMRPGRWEVSMQMDFGDKKLPPGMPLSEPMTAVDCVTAEDIKKMQGTMPLPDRSCKMSDYRASGNEIFYKVTCRDVAVDYRITFHSPDAYSGVSNSHGKDPSEKMTFKFSGKRTGPACSAKELAEDADDENE